MSCACSDGIVISVETAAGKINAVYLPVYLEGMDRDRVVDPKVKIVTKRASPVTAINSNSLCQSLSLTSCCLLYRDNDSS